MKNLTLGNILKHWTGGAPPIEPTPLDELNNTDWFPDVNCVELPFHLENFCRENDELLKLIPHPDIVRRMFAVKGFLPTRLGPVEVWIVYEGFKQHGTTGKMPIAWFSNTEDCNRFVYGAPIKTSERSQIELATTMPGKT